MEKPESLFFQVFLEANYSMAFYYVIIFPSAVENWQTYQIRKHTMYYSKDLCFIGEAEFAVLNTVNLLPHCKSKNCLQDLLED